MIKKSILILGVIFLLVFSPTLVGQAEFVIVPPSAFNCMTGFGNWVKSDGAEQYLYIKGGVEEMDRIYMAPVYFPPSATGKKVKRMSVTVLDDSNTAGISVRLRKTDLLTGDNHWLVFFVGTGLGDTPGKVLLHDSTTTESRKINNKRWAWDLMVAFEFVPSPEDSLRLYSVRIKFE
jgi:hypothetical protein